MLWRVRECSRTPLRGFQPQWLPPDLPDGLLAFSQGDLWGIEVESLVGTVPLRNGDTLHVLPKVAGANFMRMLLEAEMAMDSSMWSSEELASFDLSDELSLASLIARPFVISLKAVRSGSLRFDWGEVPTWSEYAGGRLDLFASVLGMRQNKRLPLKIRRKFRDYDTPENRVLLAAAAQCFTHHGALLSRDDRKFLIEFQRHFRVGQMSVSDIEDVAAGLSNRRFDGPRGYYTSALRLAQIVLGELGLAQGDEKIQAQPVLFNSATIFERFVRSHLSKRYGALGLTVRKGFFPERFLFADGTTLLEPDLVVMKDDEIRLVGDMKYKLDRVTSDDNYQLHAYALRGGVTSAAFFCAAEIATTTRVVTRASRLGVSVYEIHLPLSNIDATVRSLRQLERHLPAFQPY